MTAEEVTMCKHYTIPCTPRNKAIYFTHLGAECYWEHLGEYKDSCSYIYIYIYIYIYTESCVRTLSCLYLMAHSNLMCRIISSGTMLNLAVWSSWL